MEWGAQRELELAFDSDRKRMTVLCAVPLRAEAPWRALLAPLLRESGAAEGGAATAHVALVKGASEAIVRACSGVLTRSGEDCHVAPVRAARARCVAKCVCAERLRAAVRGAAG